MTRTIERSLAVLLALGGAGHAFGSYTAFRHAPITLLWSLCAALFLFLLAALNWLRASRPNDTPLLAICLAGNTAWIAVAVAFGMLIGRPFDPRTVGFVLICSALIVAALARNGGRQVPEATI